VEVSTATLRAVIYTRISRDDEEQRLGVQRQEKDLRREAERRHARIVTVLSDNDISGEGKAERPDFNRLVDMIRNGDVDLVLAADLDRLTRGFRPYVLFYEACSQAKITVAWLGGQANFATGEGLLELEIRASFAHEELRKIRSRAKRKHLELAEKGLDVGGGRAFGFEDDRKTIRPVEAQLIREATDRVLAGASLRSVAVDWQRRGIRTVTGKGAWSIHVVRRVLGSARISGRRERVHVDGHKRPIGIIVENVRAAWPAIISDEKSDAMRRLLGNPDRRKNGHAQSYLLTGGVARCGAPHVVDDEHPDGLCGKPLIARPRADKRRCMVCASGPGFFGCGKIRTLADPVEERVVEAVLRRVDKGALAKAMRGKDDAKVASELVGVEGRLDELARQWAKGDITSGERAAARQVLVARQAALNQRLDGGRRAESLDGLPVDERLRKLWPTLELHRQRAIISALVERVTIMPAVRGRNTFDAKRIDVTWRA
jgi:site-specific DNA recombinase